MHQPYVDPLEIVTPDSIREEERRREQPSRLLALLKRTPIKANNTRREEMIKNLLNLTPHDVYYVVSESIADGMGQQYLKDTTVGFWMRSGHVARVESTQAEMPMETLTMMGPDLGGLGDGGVEIVAPPAFGAVSGIPDDLGNHNGIMVSFLCGQALRAHGWDRCPVYSSDTGPNGAVRDENGRITGTRRLIRWV